MAFQCEKRVYRNIWTPAEQCTKPGKVQCKGKWYCGIHDPVRQENKQAERQAERNARWKAEVDAREAARTRSAAERAVIDAARIFAKMDDGEAAYRAMDDICCAVRALNALEAP